MNIEYRTPGHHTYGLYCCTNGTHSSLSHKTLHMGVFHNGYWMMPHIPSVHQCTVHPSPPSFSMPALFAITSKCIPSTFKIIIRIRNPVCWAASPLNIIHSKKKRKKRYEFNCFIRLPLIQTINSFLSAPAAMELAVSSTQRQINSHACSPPRSYSRHPYDWRDVNGRAK